MIIKTIVFKREKDSPQEIGIEVEGSVIIDRHQKVVPAPIWNAKDIHGLALDLFPLLNSLSQTTYLM